MRLACTGHPWTTPGWRVRISAEEVSTSRHRGLGGCCVGVSCNIEPQRRKRVRGGRETHRRCCGATGGPTVGSSLMCETEDIRVGCKSACSLGVRQRAMNLCGVQSYTPAETTTHQLFQEW
jgi:hypothetical protein